MKGDVPALIARKHRQLLVHSFVYYRLNDTLIPDATFDEWRRELSDLHTAHPAIARKAPYYDICKGFQNNPSGYFIKDYPVEIQSVALRLLYADRGQGLDFTQFAARLGFTVEGEV